MRGPTNKLYPVRTLSPEAVAAAEVYEAALLADAGERGFSDGQAGLAPRERSGFTWQAYMLAWRLGREAPALDVEAPIPFELTPDGEAVLAATAA